jgi:hypothetical protein
VAAIAAACDLNPQPLPPGFTSEDGGFGAADAATTTPVEGADGGGLGVACDATVCPSGPDAASADAAEDSAPVPADAALDGSDGGGDAREDANEDAGDALWDAALD